MHYVKQFNINGVDTKQVACIELRGKPNAATEGYVGVLGIDIVSPFHEVYKCVAVNGSIYTWELLSSGMSIMSATISGGSVEYVQFPYANLLTPSTYVVKPGDLILDNEGYLYQITSLNSTYCVATYCGTQVVAYGKSAYDLAVKNGFEGDETEWLASLKGDKGGQGIPGKSAYEQALEGGYTGTEDEFTAMLSALSATVPIEQGGTGATNAADALMNLGLSGFLNTNAYTRMESGWYNGTGTESLTLTFSFVPKLILIVGEVSDLRAPADITRDTCVGFVLPDKGVHLGIHNRTGDAEFMHFHGLTGETPYVSISDTSVTLYFPYGAYLPHTMLIYNYPANEASENSFGYWYYAFG